MLLIAASFRRYLYLDCAALEVKLGKLENSALIWVCDVTDPTQTESDKAFKLFVSSDG